MSQPVSGTVPVAKPEVANPPAITARYVFGDSGPSSFQPKKEPQP